MLIAGLLFSCMGVLVKLGSVYFSSTELVFYRSIIGFLIISVIIGIKRLPISTLHWKNHCWRGLSGLCSLLMFFYCITKLPLATAVTLSYTSPLFLTLFTTIMLKEHFPLATCGCSDYWICWCRFAITPLYTRRAVDCWVNWVGLRFLGSCRLSKYKVSW